MRNARLRKSALLVSAIAMVLAACGGSDAPASDAPSAPAPQDSGDGELSVPDSPADGVTSSAIRIGWMGDVTGPTASAQIFNLRGIEAYFDFVNSEGGVLGRNLEVIVKDDEYGAELGVSNFTSLLSDERVIAINNVGGSHIIGAFLEDAERASLPIVSIAQTTTEQLESPVAFHTLAHYFDMADVAVARMIEAVGGAENLRVGVAHLEVPSGLEWDEGIRKAVDAQGGTYLGTIPIPIAAADAGSFVGSVRRLVDNEGMNYLALHGAPSHGLFAVNSLAGADLLIPIAGMQGIASLNIFEEGAAAQTAITEGIHSFVTFADDTPGSAVIRDFIAGAGSRYADDAKHINFTHGWVGGKIIHQAILAAAETGSLTRASLLAAMTGTFEMEGLTCDVDWTSSNHSPCAAPFSHDGENMRIVGSFEDWSSSFRRDYTLG
jgi:ABC-type branched-subunit amino acid transport system substrate-binding protein